MANIKRKLRVPTMILMEACALIFVATVCRNLSPDLAILIGVDIGIVSAALMIMVWDLMS